MSLYIFGSLVLGSDADVRGVGAGLVGTGLVFLDGLDPEDDQITAQWLSRHKPGLVGEPRLNFRVSGACSAFAATGLWLEAQSGVAGGSARVEDTRLGRVLDLLLSVGETRLGIVAVFDGNVESLFWSDAANCRRFLFRLLGEHWDASENPMVVWEEGQFPSW